MSRPNLCEVMRQWRWATRTELKHAAAEIGIGDSTLSRFERGDGMVGGETLAKIIQWLLSDAPAGQQRLGLEQPREGAGQPPGQEPSQ
jgi:transcriptional regulator with XRE-family HTH domain